MMSTVIAEPTYSPATLWQQELDDERERADYVCYWTERLVAWQRSWQSQTKRSLPLIREAKQAFQNALLGDGDLGFDQLQAFSHSVFSRDESDFLCWLRSTTERFMLRVRPWFPLWTGYTSWILDWCKARDYKQVAFLARDSIPFYVAAHQLTKSASADLDLRILHAPRHITRSIALEHHLNQSIDWHQPVALVDSGCYGTIMAELVRYQRQTVGSVDRLAAFFFFSRHPRIFGYVNYLMSQHILAEAGFSLTDRGARNFIIYAGDVLEAMPKPYQLLSLEPDGRPQIHLQDLTSFALSMRLLEEIRQFAALRREHTVVTAIHAMSRLYQFYSSAETDPLAMRCLLFNHPAPKAAPSSELLKDLEYADLPPQNEIFGTLVT